MQVSKVSYLQVRNMGNYEKKESMAEIALVEGDCANIAIAEAQRLVAIALGLKTEAKATVKTKEVVKEVVVAEVVEAEKTKRTRKLAVKKEVVIVTKEEVLNAMRSYAEAKDSKEMAVEVLHDVTGKKKLAEVDAKLYGKLVKALAV